MTFVILVMSHHFNIIAIYVYTINIRAIYIYFYYVTYYATYVCYMPYILYTSRYYDSLPLFALKKISIDINNHHSEVTFYHPLSRVNVSAHNRKKKSQKSQ